MKVSYVEVVAKYNGPESYGAAREGGVEALAGGRTGRVLSREIHARLRKQQVLRDADAVEECGRRCAKDGDNRASVGLCREQA